MLILPIVLVVGCSAANAAESRPLVGAIRWDAWHDHAKTVADAIGAQAISSYAIGGGSAMNATPYSKLADTAKWFWEECVKTGAQVVPIAMAGWDRRPRVEHPVPWEKNQKPGEGIDKYYQMPTPGELAAHIEDAMRWTMAHEKQCPARTVIVYAWNEHDEGGWLCPTLNPDGTPNTSRLDAIAAMLEKIKQLRGCDQANRSCEIALGYDLPKQPT